MYVPFEVSILILSPSFINNGTCIVAPVSVVAGLKVLVAVFPLTPGSVCWISKTIWDGSDAESGKPSSAWNKTSIFSPSLRKWEFSMKSFCYVICS